MDLDIGQWMSGQGKMYLLFLFFMLYQIITFTNRSYLTVYVIIFTFYAYYLFDHIVGNKKSAQTVHVFDKYVDRHQRCSKDAARLIKNDKLLSRWMKAFWALRYVDPSANIGIIKKITMFFHIYAKALRHSTDPVHVVHLLTMKKHEILNDLHRFYMQVQENKKRMASQFSSSNMLLLATLGKCIDALTLKNGLPDMRHAQAANMYGDIHDIF